MGSGRRRTTAANRGPLSPTSRPSSCLPPRCNSAHLCTHGEGHCSSSTQCERSGYHVCGPDCIGPTFPPADLPNNTDIKYHSADKCCARR